VRTFEAIAQKRHSGGEYRLSKSPERLCRTGAADRAEPLIIQGLTPDVIDSKTVTLEIPQQPSAH
jgi:hypothetical protein